MYDFCPFSSVHSEMRLQRGLRSEASNLPSRADASHDCLGGKQPKLSDDEISFSRSFFFYLGTVAPSVHEKCFSGTIA